ncbi:MAG: ABC transporter ATP-binding protein [Cardiobacteriaceae bacterium]|nr:ABC transporter ATP-binding protein [Cardiobacteriaceae bacterium]
MNVILEHLRISYEQDVVISDLSYTFAGGHWHVILGKSGIGKSTLLRAIASLIPYTGKITCSSPSLMAQHDDLLPWLDVKKNVTLGARLRGEKANDKQATQLLEKVGLDAHIHKRPEQLSGGQRQRVALARTLYEKRDLLLMDEPFSAVDAVTRYQLQNLALKLLRNKTVIMITHDPAEALHLADYLYILHNDGLHECTVDSVETLLEMLSI